MLPVQLVVTNLAGGHQHKGSAAYSFVAPSLPLAGAGTGGEAEAVAMQQQQQAALEAAAEAAGKQVAALESHCDGVLRRLKAQCHKVKVPRVSDDAQCHQVRNVHLQTSSALVQ